jgi:hypothetical protein
LFRASLALISWFTLGGIALADDVGPITIPAAVNYADDAAVPPAVRNECKLETELTSWIKTFADQFHVRVTVAGGDTAKATGRVLKVKISNVLGAGGGAYSGGKSVQVKGELREGDKVIGTFGQLLTFNSPAQLTSYLAGAVMANTLTPGANPSRQCALGEISRDSHV